MISTRVRCDEANQASDLVKGQMNVQEYGRTIRILEEHNIFPVLQYAMKKVYNGFWKRSKIFGLTNFNYIIFNCKFTG